MNGGQHGLRTTRRLARRRGGLAGAVLVGALLALGAMPPQAALGCTMAPVPAYPGARPLGSPDAAASGTVPGPGGSLWATDDPLASVQQFYYMRLLNAGWAEVPQLPGQYIEQFGGRGGSTAGENAPLGVLEFERDDGQQRVRLVGEAGGYSLWLDCRD
ncbi:MAG TPA: hypothetical protein VK066_30335 [Chloroflexota bacterium]|nr:hypothetical protein [Chloroflexota bacterium]